MIIRPISAALLGAVVSLGCQKADHELTVSGQIMDVVGPALGVTARASCGAKEFSVAADSDGKYHLEIDTLGCSSVALRFEKESYLPLMRVVPVPPPTSPLTVNVKVARLSEVRCGTSTCVLDGTQGEFPSERFARGFATTMSGKQALDFVGGELRDSEGRVVWMNGFGYFDFRDSDGNTIQSFDQGFLECFNVDPEAQKWLVDVDPAADGVQLSVYDLDVTSGRWQRRDEPGFLQYTKMSVFDTATMLSHDLLEPLANADLPNVVSQQFGGKKIWFCAPVRGSGWMSWGRTNEPRSCVVFRTEDDCHGGVSDAVVDLRGRDFGFFATAWTSPKGEACVEIAPSEPTGEDYDGDLNRGETFFVDFTISTPNAASSQRAAFESPRSHGSCALRESCFRPSVLTLHGANPKCVARPN
jgi:hypothetical protein